MGIARVRVEMKAKGDHYDRDREFRFLLRRFNRAVQDAGIMQTAKMKESYESPGRKRRRKKKEAEIARLKSKLRDNFVGRGKKHDE